MTAPPAKRRPALRKFLYFVTICIVLVFAGLFVLRIYADELTEVALIPDTEFVEQAALETNAYQDPQMWFSRPGKGVLNDPARWQPEMAEQRSMPSPADPSPTPLASEEPETASEEGAQTPETPRFAVFFVHPTSYFERTDWNAPLAHEESQKRAKLMVRGLASAFNQADEIWVPRYRQATFGAFLTDAPEAQRALDAAYLDIAQAFDFFLDSIGDETAIVLAGHSQGSYMVTRLLNERVRGTPLQARIAMAYPIGWPISVTNDLPQLGLPACAAPGQGGCIIGWASFAEPAEPGQFFKRYAATPGLDGEIRGSGPILCSNPLTGTIGGEAEMALNLGTLVPNEDLTSGELVPGAVAARCDPDTGLLLIGDPPDLGQYVLPGNNYHVYDIPLFWKNLQQDVVTRVQAWQQAQPSQPS